MNSEKPLAGGDRIKIVIFFLFLAGTIFFGVIPILIALSGVYIMKKDKSFSAIKNSEKYIKLYLIMLALGLTIAASIDYYQHKDTFINYEKCEQLQKDNPDKYISIFSSVCEEKNTRVEVETAMIAGGGILLTPVAVYLLMLLFKFLYFKPLEEHNTWVVKNGIFSDIKVNEENNANTGIIGRDKLTSFSVADELIKWSDLLERDLISQEEFDKSKQKLLNQK